MILLVSLVMAYESGRTGSSVTGCTTCHGRSADTTTSVAFATDTDEVAPGGSVAVTFIVGSSSSSRVAAGLDVSDSGGTLTAGSNNRASSGEITHSSPQSFTSGEVSFDFTWTAPTTEGTYTLYGAGNAVNDNGSSSGDGWNTTTVTITVDDGCDDLDGDFYETCDGDCDDGDASVNPGADEVCDGEDQDCDETVDEDPVDGVTSYLDDDGDGYGEAGTGTVECELSEGRTLTGGDCDDTVATTHPGAEETCDGVDEDCDDAVDEDAVDATRYWLDNDGDGFGDADSPVDLCSATSGYTAEDTDCDDTRGDVNPLGTEVCDALDLDEDCDGAADDADDEVAGRTDWYLDEDEDGYGAGDPVPACDTPSGTVAFDGDCNDTDATYNPAASEACDDPTDYNCDGSTGYADGDGDGWAACAECDDAVATVNPDATESCNLVDDDCDGTVDEADASDASTWYADADADGYGDASVTTTACTQPEGYTARAGDCLDSDSASYPDATEVWYDGVDQDCDGNDTDQDGDGFPVDEDCLDTDLAVYPGAPDAWYDDTDSDCAGDSDFDADADGHDSVKYGGDDCDDARADVYPGAPDEPYDDVITDCDGSDEHDADGDGFDVDIDCDDANSSINPAADEVWYDGVDQDCDGNDDDQDADGVGAGDDCDDEDPAVALDCDTAGETGGDDTAAEDPKEEGCSCGTGSSVVGLGMLAGAWATRRRISPRRSARRH